MSESLVIWKPIEGYEGLYDVSNTGEVKSIARLAHVTKRKVPERILKHNIQHGYHCVILQREGCVKGFKVHRLVMQAFGETPPSYVHQINHMDGDKSNNSIGNLEWVTPQENTDHAFQNNLRQRHPSKECIEKRSKVMKERWKSPKYRRSQSKMMTEMWKRRKESGWTTWKTT